MKKRSFLSRLHTNGTYYLVGALLLLLGVPLYQFLVLIPQGYNDALAATSRGHFTAYLVWIGNHEVQFIGYRALLAIAFALLLSLPFTLFRIIVAQEVLGREEDEEGQVEDEEEGSEETEQTDKTESTATLNWRGKGFAVLAAWGGLFGIILYILGIVASTIYLASAGAQFIVSKPGEAATTIQAILSIITNTAGGGLLALSCLFFGAMIARSGIKLWPGIWVAFGYMALALAALFSGSAVEVATAPTLGQAALTTPAILLFALWVLWFGWMLVRLKPEE